MSHTTRVSLTINGKPVEAEVEPRTHLADFLREERHLTGTHIGCEHGVCGACTVLIDGETARSCITWAVACDGADIRTVEGFADDPLMSALRDAFHTEHGLQCGYCTPGQLITARDMVRRLGNVDNARIRTELSGNLCRCTGYVGIVNAIRKVMDEAPQGAGTGTPPIDVATPTGGTLAGFEPRDTGPAPPTPVAVAKGGAAIEESFTIGQPAGAVWEIFQDLPALAACLPGAEVTEQGDDGHVAGRIVVRFGPMKAAFEGGGTVTLDTGAMRGAVRGEGRDSLSGSRATGEITWRVAKDGEGARVDISVDYALTGPLAQFGRSGLVRDFAARLTATFVENLRRRMAGGPGALRAAELGGLSLLLSVLWGRVRRLFGG